MRRALSASASAALLRSGLRYAASTGPWVLHAERPAAERVVTHQHGPQQHCRNASAVAAMRRAACMRQQRHVRLELLLDRAPLHSRPPARHRASARNLRPSPSISRDGCWRLPSPSTTQQGTSSSLCSSAGPPVITRVFTLNRVSARPSTGLEFSVIHIIYNCCREQGRREAKGRAGRHCDGCQGRRAP